MNRYGISKECTGHNGYDQIDIWKYGDVQEILGNTYGSSEAIYLVKPEVGVIKCSSML